jgi:hypothetical protein
MYKISSMIFYSRRHVINPTLKNTYHFGTVAMQHTSRFYKNRNMTIFKFEEALAPLNNIYKVSPYINNNTSPL